MRNKVSASGYLDKLDRGYRVYVIARRKRINGDNVVLHESWHSTLNAAESAYAVAVAPFCLISEYTNCATI